MSNTTLDMDCQAFTDDARVTLDAITGTHRRILRRPNHIESLRPAGSRGSFVLPHLAPSVGAQKGDFRMVPDSRFVEDSGIRRFSRPMKNGKR